MKSVYLFAVVLAAGVTASCLPHRDVPASEVPNIKSLKDLMDVQQTTADPQMDKRGQATYTDADFAAFAETASRIQATSIKAKDWTKGPGFDALADKLHASAVSLSTAAAAKDAKGSSDALTSMKAACKECHSKFD